MRKRTLFLGGDPFTAEEAHGLLKGMGHLVHIETSGAEGLVVFSQNPNAFDLIVADISMPDISGLLLVKKLFNVRPDIPIILLADKTGQAQAEARNTGVHWFSMKPLSAADLAGTVKNALSRKGKPKPHPKEFRQNLLT